MGELRERMAQDMQVRDFSPRTQEAYLAAVTGLAAYYHKGPDPLSDEEAHRYLLHVREERQLSLSTRNQIRCGLKFFYDVTVRRPQAALTVPVARQPQKLPAILSREEVTSLLEATTTLRRRVGSGSVQQGLSAIRPAQRGHGSASHGRLDGGKTP